MENRKLMSECTWAGGSGIEKTNHKKLRIWTLFTQWHRGIIEKKL